MISMEVDGTLEMTFEHLSGAEVPKEEEAVIFDKLRSGVFIISLQKREVFEQPNYDDPIYKFDYEVGCSTQYDFIDMTE